MPWKWALQCLAVDALQQPWMLYRPYAFPLFSDRENTKEVEKISLCSGENCPYTHNSNMAKPALEPNAFPMAIAYPVLLPWKSTILANPQGDSHPPTPSINDLINLRNNLETVGRTVGTQKSDESS